MGHVKARACFQVPSGFRKLEAASVRKLILVTTDFCQQSHHLSAGNTGIARVLCNRKGLSLLELVVVIVILAALAGMLLSNLDGVDDSAEKIATQKTLVELRDAFTRYWQDVKHTPAVRQVLDPVNLSAVSLQLVASPRCLLENREIDGTSVNPMFPAFNAETQVGWRGPYVSAMPTLYRFDSTNTPGRPELHDPSGFVPNYGDGLPNDPYGFATDLSVRDSFRRTRPNGRPIVVQMVPVTRFGQLNHFDVRIVSAGIDGELTVPLLWENEALLLSENALQIGDDIYVAFEVRP